MTMTPSPAQRRIPIRSAATARDTQQQRQQHRDDFQVEFTFINGTKSKEQRKKSRSHVTTQHYRRKRHEKAAQETVAPRTEITAANPNITSDEQRPPNGNTLPLLPIPYYARGRYDPFAATTFPIAPNPHIHELVDHYCYVIPSLVHRHWARATRRSRSAWDLFDLYRRDSISFTAILHHASQHLAGIHGNRAESASSTSWKLRTISGIQARLASASTQQYNASTNTIISSSPATLESFAHDDGLIIAVGLLANAERLWGDRDVARIHWATVKRMLRARGGFPSLTNNKAMHTKLLWSYIALTGTTAYLPEEPGPAYEDDFGIAGMSVPFPNTTDNNQNAPETQIVCPYSQATNATFTFPTDTALSLSTDEFTQLISVRLAQESAFTRRRQRQRHEQLQSDQQQRQQDQEHHPFFHPTHPLHGCLAPIASTRYAHPDKRRAHENCRLACLLFLNIVVAELFSSSSSSPSATASASTGTSTSTLAPASTSIPRPVRSNTSNNNNTTSPIKAFFTDLTTLITTETAENGKSDAALTPEHLLWTLLSTSFGGEPEQRVFERGWKVARLQGVAKRLGPAWWRRVVGGLWGLLIGEDGVETGGGLGMDMGMNMGTGMGEGPGAGAGSGPWWCAEGFVHEVRRPKEWVGEEDGVVDLQRTAEPSRRSKDGWNHGVGIGECPSGKCGM